MDLGFHYMFLLLLVLGVIFMLILGIAYILKREKALRKALETQALKRNGNVSRSFLFSYPKLTFTHNTNEVAVYSVPGSRYSPPYTYVKVKLQMPINHTIRIYKEKFTQKIGKVLGMQDIQIDSDSFDNEFIIKGSDEFYVRNLLIFSIQDMLLSLSKFNPLIELIKQTLEIRIPDVITDEYAYDQLIDTALKMVDRINEIKSY